MNEFNEDGTIWKLRNKKNKAGKGKKLSNIVFEQNYWLSAGRS